MIVKKNRSGAGPHPPLVVRLMAGLLILKHMHLILKYMHSLSDEAPAEMCAATA